MSYKMISQIEQPFEYKNNLEQDEIEFKKIMTFSKI